MNSSCCVQCWESEVLLRVEVVKGMVMMMMMTMKVVVDLIALLLELYQSLFLSIPSIQPLEKAYLFPLLTNDFSSSLRLKKGESKRNGGAG